MPSLRSPQKFPFPRSVNVAAFVVGATITLVCPAAAKACGDFVPMLGVGPVIDATTGWHTAAEAGAEFNHDFRWFCGLHFIGSTNPGIDAVVEGGRYFGSGMAHVGLGVGYGGGHVSGARPVVLGEMGLLGRGLNVDVLVRPGSDSREVSGALMIDIVHFVSWMAECVVSGGSGVGPSHDCGS